MKISVIFILIIVRCTLCQVTDHHDEYCISEFFRPRCTKNEVILMKNATYGRMRVGRCLAAEEVDALRAIAGNDPRYFGCHADVLEILDQICSGKTECDVRVAEILEKNIRPCFTGLMVYLEASYDCIAVVDEKQSCLVKALMKPIHIIGLFSSRKICGTKSQPWIVESSAGQRISIGLIDLNSKQTVGGKKQQCFSYGSIEDKTENRNISICGGRGQRQDRLYVSTGYTLNIFFDSIELKEGSHNDRNFMLRIEAVGCSEIVPPEDTWLKRKDDAVVIGCYSTRQTWQLSCNEGKWIGVLGNCSNKINSGVNEFDDKSKSIQPTISDQEQVLAIVAISGCAFAICLTIVCVGAICLRRYYVRYKGSSAYKTLSLSRNPDAAQRLILGAHPITSTETLDRNEQGNNKTTTLMPTYSAYIGNNALYGDNY